MTKDSPKSQAKEERIQLEWSQVRFLLTRHSEETKKPAALCRGLGEGRRRRHPICWATATVSFRSA